MQKSDLKGIYFKELQNGDISWYIKCRLNGNPTTVKIGNKKKDKIKTAQEAYKFYYAHKSNSQQEKDEIEEIERVEQVKENFAIQQSDKKIYTLNDLALLYFDRRKSKVRRKLREKNTHLKNEEQLESLPLLKIKLKGVQKEIYQYNKYVKNSKIGNMVVDKITMTELDEFLYEDLGESFLTEKSKFNIMSYLKTVVNSAITHLIVDIKNPFVQKVKNPRKQRERVLSPEEIKLLLDTAKTHNTNVYMPIYLAVLTAGRVNTILNIRKKDINLQEKTIYLNNIKASKQYKLALNDKSVAWFSKILVDYENDEYLVRSVRPHLKQTKNFTQMMTMPKKVYEIMDELFNQGLDKQNNQDRDFVVNFHSIRRSVATNLARQGTSLYDVMVFLNHSSIEQTMKYLNMTSTNLGNEHNKLMSKIFVEY